MFRGFYTAASGMMAQQRHTEIISDNIANMNTPGYKTEQSTLRSFPELLIQQMGTNHIPIAKGLQIPYSNPVGSLATGVYTQETVADFSQGPVQETGFGTDLAIVNGELPDETGSIFFTLENDAGEERYTRNGHFTVDGDGFLVANNGYYVLNEGGNRIQTNNMEFNVLSDGTIQMENTATILGLSYIENANDLIKEVDDVYQLENGTSENVQAVGAGFQVLQGSLEGSNVNAMQAMTEMMSSYRSFEQNQQVLKAYDQSMGKAVSEIARLR